MEWKMKFSAVRKILIKLKVYWSRTGSYLSLINSVMILYLLLSNLKEFGYFNIRIDTLIIPLIIFGIITLIFVGWVEIELLRGNSEEQRFMFELNPSFVDLRNKIDVIYQYVNNEEKLTKEQKKE